MIASRRFVRFLGIATLLTVVLIAIGVVPTQRVLGQPAMAVVVLGCGISLFASVCGAVAILANLPVSAVRVGPVVVQAMLVRFLVTAALTAAMVVGDFVPRTPLLLWVAVSYMVLLIVDTHFAVRMTAPVGPKTEGVLRTQ